MSRQMEEKIAELKVVPVVVLEDAKDAAPLAKALCEGGLPCAEVTFRTAAAKDSIKAMSEAYPEMLVGAGTVLTKEQVDSAVEYIYSINKCYYGNTDISNIIEEEIASYFSGQKSAQEVAKVIQSRAQIYVDEKR